MLLIHLKHQFCVKHILIVIQTLEIFYTLLNRAGNICQQQGTDVSPDWTRWSNKDKFKYDTKWHRCSTMNTSTMHGSHVILHEFGKTQPWKCSQTQAKQITMFKCFLPITIVLSEKWDAENQVLVQWAQKVLDDQTNCLLRWAWPRTNLALETKSNCFPTP